MENQTGQAPKRNSNIIYVLIVLILGLIALNFYFYFQKNKSDLKIVYQSDEKTRLQTKLDSLEAQVEQVNAVNSGNVKLSKAMEAKNDSLKSRIKVLRAQLAKGKLTKEELAKAEEDIKQLRYFVTKYTVDIEDLKKQNTSLVKERDTLKTTLATTTQKAAVLEKQKDDLDAKVKIGSAIKLAESSIVAYKIRSSGKEVDVTRASTAKKIKINFTVASNEIATKGLHDIFIRIIDPTGNLITSNDSGTFSSDGQDLQFTYKTSIEFKDDGSAYTIDWINPVAFQKGTYTVIFYADGYTMGKTTFSLR